MSHILQYQSLIKRASVIIEELLRKEADPEEKYLQFMHDLQQITRIPIPPKYEIKYFNDGLSVCAICGYRKFSAFTRRGKAICSCKVIFCDDCYDNMSTVHCEDHCKNKICKQIPNCFWHRE